MFEGWLEDCRNYIGSTTFGSKVLTFLDYTAWIPDYLPFIPIGPTVRFNPNQQALVDLAKQAKVRGGLSVADYKILEKWSIEYGLPARYDIEGQIGKWASKNPHFHIGPINHIPIK